MEKTFGKKGLMLSKCTENNFENIVLAADWNCHKLLSVTIGNLRYIRRNKSYTLNGK